MFLFVLGALVAFTFLIMMAAGFIGDSLEQAKSEDPMRQAAIERRVAPVGRVRITGDEAPAEPPAAAPLMAAAAGPRSGAEVYQAACMACHASGAAGAPMIGDKAAWQPRVAVPLGQLVDTVISGKGAMPARAGNPALTDDEIRAAVQHMLQQTGLEAGAEAAAAMAAPATPAPTPDAGGADLAHGEQIYQSACLACHLIGAAGAPKLGDVAAWEPRISQGADALLHSVLNGKGAMPAKGGRVDLSDGDVAAAVAFMVSKSQ
jgi:cytochrome c5